MRRRAFLMGSSMIAALPGLAQAQAIDWKRAPVRLLMFERKGCVYCEAWKRQIGPGYRDSPTGNIAPLTVVDMDGPYPDGLALARRPIVTPTFVLMRDGMELGRIEGYTRQDDFYPALERLYADTGILR